MNIWTPDSSAPSVTAAEIQDWEKEQSLRMPALLREALMVHNGGTLLDTVDPSIEVRPLEDWERIDPELAELLHHEGDSRQLMAFADSDYGSCYYLNYARCDAAGEPVVGSMNQSSCDTDESDDDVATYLAKLAGDLTESPAVDGSHAAGLTLVGQAHMVTREETHHSLLGHDSDGNLVHLHHHTSEEGECWTATCLQGPVRCARLTTSEVGTNNLIVYQLQICPQQAGPVREQTSSRAAGGRWKNEVTESPSGSTLVRSLELEQILLLRRALNGPPQTQSQEEAETLHIEYLRLMAASTARERAAAELHLQLTKTTKKATRSPAKGRGLGLGSGGGFGLEALMGFSSGKLLGGKGGNSGNMMAQIVSAASELITERAGKVPEATQQLIERLVAAEAAVKEEER